MTTPATSESTCVTTSRAERYLQRTVTLSQAVPEPDVDVMLDLAERTPVTLLLKFAWSVRTDFHNPGA